MSDGDETQEQHGRRTLLIRLGVATVALAVVIDLAIGLTQQSQAHTVTPSAHATAAATTPSATPASTATPWTAALPPPPMPTPCVLESVYHQDSGQGSATLATPSCDYGGTGFFFHVSQACATSFSITGPGVHLNFDGGPNSSENEHGVHRSSSDSGYTVAVSTQDDCDWEVDLIAQ
ncbi:MAG: hypothetical protein JOZ92_01525 [Candidatus Dormibacteraeota bacterium]|nr:hypothetical protein [Candidatus Dormibacteraeota bacterium]